MAEIPEMPEELPLADEAVVIAEATTSAHRGETPERGETAHIPETAKEEMPVIDVHAPHGGVHTWKAVSYTHLDVYKRQEVLGEVCEGV